MNEFIHTFSAITHIYNTQKDLLAATFGNHFFYNSSEKHYVLSKYAADGFRVEIKYNPSKEKKYDKKHWDCKAEIIVTPSKLLYPDQPMKKLYTPQEYEQACDRLETILREIELQAGVNLWNEAKIRRIDVSKDVETPSDEYSREVIRIAKKAVYKTGYHLWIPSAEDIEKTGWKEEDSILYRNHNQDICTKIYNKLTDIEKRGYDRGNLNGLLRFELTLKRNFLKTQGFLFENHITLEMLPSLLIQVLEKATTLLQTYLVSPLWSGAMLTKDLQKKYIKCYCRRKTVKYEKMIAYRRKCNRSGIYPDPTVGGYFEEIGLSPLYVANEIRCIPSFADLLAGTRNERVERFLQFQ